MKTAFLLLFVQCFFLLKGTEGLDVVSVFQPCSAKDANLNNCVKETGQKFIPQLAAGISDWNIKPTDPLTTSEVTFETHENDNNLKLVYKNVVQTGFSTTEIVNADVDLEHKMMTFKLKYPLITFTADYEMKGKFFGFDLAGNGKANISAWNAYSSLMLKYHVDGDHIKQDSVIFGFSFDKIFLDYSNLMVNDDEELSKSAGTFMNENSKLIIGGFKPKLEEFYSKIVGECLDGLFGAIPYSVLFKTG